MSHWRSGKLQLKCSMGILRRALTSIVPEWDSHVVESEEGTLDLYDYQGHKKGSDYHLVIPGKGDPHRQAAPGFSYSGLGIRKQNDGSWVIDVDPAGLSRGSYNIIGKVNVFIAAEKVRKKASSQGNRLVSDVVDGTRRKILMTAPVEPKYKIHS
jgi:hypothetical protein